MGRRSLLLIGLFGLAPLLAACPRPPPTFGPEPYEEAEAVLAAAQARRLEPDALISDARVRLSGPAGRGSADHFIVARRPDELRFETLSFFGNPLALMMVTGGRLVLWDINANVAWVGKATAHTMGLLLPIRLEPEEVAMMLLGNPALYTEERRLDLDHERRRYVVTSRRDGDWQRVLIRPDDYTIDEIQWFDSRGEITARLDYERYRAVGEKLFPYELRYSLADGTALRVVYRDVTFDPPAEELDPLFEGRIPDRVPIVPIDPAEPPRFILPEEDEIAL